MPWIVLIVSGVLEAVWATALGRIADGPVAVTAFVVAIALSMAGLGWAVKHIPIGTAYAVWVGIGAALTVVWAMATGDEPVSTAKIVFLVGIVAAVIGLKLLPDAPRESEPASGDQSS
ncbi:DMT family transporter [Microbacterium gilvum]|uniref:Multidrug efflux SMR transporter n=1 Tax=Microbacterium gilvum TaxID=1336204 RepID=A0ABP8ZTE2_9MICO